MDLVPGPELRPTALTAAKQRNAGAAGSILKYYGEPRLAYWFVSDFGFCASSRSAFCRSFRNVFLVLSGLGLDALPSFCAFQFCFVGWHDSLTQIILTISLPSDPRSFAVVVAHLTSFVSRHSLLHHKNYRPPQQNNHNKRC